MKTTLAFLVFLAGAAAQIRPVAQNGEPALGNLPVQPIGANDLVAISVYDTPELTRGVRVGADGFIRLPMLKQRIKAAGLMPLDLESGIAKALIEEGLLVDPFVTVTVSEYSSRPISVMGAVRHPITFQATTPVTLLDALARAEGLSPEAGPEVLVSKVQPGPDGQPTTLVRRITARALIDTADPDMNLKLTGGEEIRVPEAGRVYVVGNVKKPCAFPVPEAYGSSVLKALALAEGLMPYAGHQAFIYRREAAGSQNEIPIDLGKIMDRKAPDVPLMANDILYITDAKGRRAGMLALEKILLFGTGATSALIYGAAVH